VRGSKITRGALPGRRLSPLDPFYGTQRGQIVEENMVGLLLRRSALDFLERVGPLNKSR